MEFHRKIAQTLTDNAWYGIFSILNGKTYRKCTAELCFTLPNTLELDGILNDVMKEDLNWEIKNEIEERCEE